jgi:hypothetical protein
MTVLAGAWPATEDLRPRLSRPSRFWRRIPSPVAQETMDCPEEGRPRTFVVHVCSGANFIVVWCECNECGAIVVPR